MINDVLLGLALSLGLVFIVIAMVITADYIEHLTTKPKDDYYDKEDWWGQI